MNDTEQKTQPYNDTDQKTHPYIFVFDDFELPYDTTVTINGEKELSISKIIDSGDFVQRTTKKAMEFTFDFTLREKETVKKEVLPLNNKVTRTYTKYFVPNSTNYIFPLQKNKDFFQKVWNKDGIIKLKNSYLNSIGIMEIIIENVQTSVKLGSTDISVRLKAYENIYIESSETTTLI